MEMKQSDWNQKYRPQAITEMILPEKMKAVLGEFALEGRSMSMLFCGKPGCGKTTAASLINPANTMLINCAMNNSISMVTKLIKTCSAVTLYDERRLILFDEADYLKNDAQAALRGFVEKYSLNNDFIMTANEPERLSPAIQSRFRPVPFDFIRTDEINDMLVERLGYIAKQECDVDLPAATLHRISRDCFPDIRAMISRLQYEVQGIVAASKFMEVMQ